MDFMKRILVSLILLIFATSMILAASPEVTQINYTPSPAMPGTVTTVLLQIENKGDQISENVEVSIEENFPFSAAENKTQSIGDIEKYGKSLVQFEVYVNPKAENRTYPLEIKISSESNKLGVITPKNIVVNGEQPIIKVSEISNTNLIPGQEKELTFTLKNIGTSTAYDITAELQEDRTVTTTGTLIEREITPLGAAIGYIEELNPKEDGEVKINVSVNRKADLKNYTLPVVVSYRDDSGTIINKTSYVGFKVAGKVILDATLKEKKELFAGQTTDLKIELFNKGFGKAEFTIVEIETSFGKVTKNKQFIGGLEPNDVDSFNTTLTTNMDAKTQAENIILKITYQDTDAQEKKQILKIPVKVYSSIDSAAKNPTNPLPGIIILIVGTIIVYLGYKKYKKR